MATNVLCVKAEFHRTQLLWWVFCDRMNKIYMIFIYPDYSVDPVKKKCDLCGYI